MNTKRILFGLFACVTLMVAASSCTDSTAEDDQLFEQGVDKTKLTKTL